MMVTNAVSLHTFSGVIEIFLAQPIEIEAVATIFTVVSNDSRGA